MRRGLNPLGQGQDRKLLHRVGRHGSHRHRGSNHDIPHHRRGGHRRQLLRDPLGTFLRLLRLMFKIVLLLLMIPVALSAIDSIKGPGFSSLTDGYNGPPVRANLWGFRSRAERGMCLVLIRDASSSVAQTIDPGSQIDEELATIVGALSTSAVSDKIAVVTFGSMATSSGLRAPDDPLLLSTLRDRSLGGGTEFLPALEAASRTQAECPPARKKFNVLVTDGVSSSKSPLDDISNALSALEGAGDLIVIALDPGGFEKVKRPWSASPVTSTTRITRLRPGVIARALANAVENMTGQIIDVGFESADQNSN